MANKTKLVINRSRWLRGDPDNSMLLRPGDWKMCCLGFYARTLGFLPGTISALASPWDTPDPDRWPTWLLQRVDDCGEYRDTSACNLLIRENDAPAAPEAEREKRIAAIFARHGVAVEFV